MLGEWQEGKGEKVCGCVIKRSFVKKLNEFKESIHKTNSKERMQWRRNVG